MSPSPPGRTAGGGAAPMTAGGPRPGVAGEPEPHDGTAVDQPAPLYALHLTSPQGETRTVTNVLSADIVRQHSDLSDWQFTVPRDESLREWRFSEVEIRHRGRPLFEGRLRRIAESESGAETTLEGFGPLGPLRFGEISLDETNVNLHQLIERVWADWTPFDALVLQPDTHRHFERVELSGKRLKVIKDLHEAAGMRFYPTIGDTDGPDVIVFSPGEIVRPAGWTRLDSSPKYDVGEYRNQVVVRGAFDSTLGRHHQALVEDRNDIRRVGLVGPERIIDPTLTSDADCRERAKQVLADRLDEDQLSGSIDITPRLIPPGVRVPVPLFDGDEKSIERVSYRESHGQASGTVDFEAPFSVAARAEEINSDLEETKEVLS